MQRQSEQCAILLPVLKNEKVLLNKNTKKNVCFLFKYTSSTVVGGVASYRWNNFWFRNE